MKKGHKFSNEQCLVKRKLWENPSYREQQRISHLGHKPWNKNLTKETDERIAKYSKSMAISQKKRFENNPKLREDASRRMTEFMKKNDYGFMGEYWSIKNNKDIPYRSSYEFLMFILLEMFPFVEKYEYEPFYISYKRDGILKYTLPDLLVYYKDGTKELIEVKSLFYLNTDDAKLKIDAMKKYANDNKIGFRLMTEKELIYV